MKSYKTPLRYPGGKSRACKKMDPYFPDLRDYKEYHEPFIGGGSVALHITKKYPHLKVWVNDLHYPLATFWQQLQENGSKMESILDELKSKYPDPDTAGSGYFDFSSSRITCICDPFFCNCCQKVARG